jgi:hypothetical protein
MPSAKKLEGEAKLPTGASAFASRLSLRMREMNRPSIKKAPVTQVTPSTTAIRPRVITQTGLPITSSGLAHVKWDAQTLSTSAPEGKTRLNAVATQIQYFVVALARRTDVKAHVIEATIEANSV